MPEFLDFHDRCKEFAVEGAVVTLRWGKCLGVESHLQPALVMVTLLEERGSDVGGRGVGDKLDLGRGAAA